MNWLAVFALFLLWIVLHLKTSRPDGTLIRDLHPYRRIMGYIMPGRNESVVYFDSFIDAEALLSYLPKAKEKFDVDISHCLVAAIAITMHEQPTMNRFSVGRRLYQRKGVFVTFSMKRRALDRVAKLATVKMQFDPGEAFRAFCERVNAKIGVERSPTRTYADREFDVFEAMPRPVLRGGVALMRLADYFNLLPGSFIENDPMYTSVFVANLGSLDMRAGYHHLYEYGTCSAFLMAGKIEPRPVVVDGRVVARDILHIRWTYDERMDDGLNARFGLAATQRVLENPYEYFGCLSDDGSDARPLGAPREAVRRLSEASVGARAAG
jgi:hypothetical protein